MENLIIKKFGGTSILKGVENILEIIKKEDKNKLLIILSALSGITNILQNICKLNKQQQIKDLRDIYKNYINKYVISKMREIYLVNYLEKKLNEINNLSNNEKIDLKNRDLLLSYGERITVFLFYNILIDKGLKCSYINSDKFIITDSNYGNANVNFNKIKNKINLLKMKLIHNKIVITTGYIGKNIKGNITTLGRGGSDYTATIIGKLLHPKYIYIYTDVDGIYTSDPNQIENSILIKYLTYKELAEMSYFGAKVIYSKTLMPIMDLNIPLRILNTFNLKCNGTLCINKLNSSMQSINNSDIRAITSIDDHSLLCISGKGMIGATGIIYRVFKVLYKVYNQNIVFVTQASSEQMICISILNNNIHLVKQTLINEFKKELYEKKICDINILDNISIITVIGENMINNYGICGKIFTLLGNNKINILAISQGSSEIGISFIVNINYKNNTIRLLNELIKTF
jgi:bifunctional aspartokinase / homoserine dehydrogenase 1